MVSQQLSKTELNLRINQLRKEKKAIILAHYYQEPEIQDIADFVGDSLELSQKAAETDAKIIVFAGVHFMAETAKVLNPDKLVLVPDKKAGCSLADNCTPEQFKPFIDQHPNHVVITYMNTSAEIKAMSDWICTSSNAEAIVRSLPENQPIIFAPDKNLGAYVKKQTGRDMVLWNGVCVVHEAFSMEKITRLLLDFPQAQLIAHPESEPHILRIAHFVGSTSKLIRYVKQHPNKEFIVATEAGILHRMRQEVPDATLMPAPINEDNTCACSECAFMKMNTLEKVYKCLLNEFPTVEVPDEVRKKALIPIHRMLEFSKQPTQ